MKKIYLFLFLLLGCYNVMAEDNSTCGTAIAIHAEGGEQSVVYVEGQKQYWYRYDAPADRDVLLMVTVPEEFKTIKLQGVSSCDEELSSYPSDATNGLQVQLARGSSYFIVFQQPTSMWGAQPAEIQISSFTVSVEEITLGGASCDDALVLKDGANKIVANSTGGGYFPQYATWVKYTATKTGKLFFVCDKTNAPTSLYRYSACDASAIAVSEDGYGSDIYILEVEAGETILLKLDNKGVCTVTLTLQELEQGDNRDNPLPIEFTGDNVCKATRVGSHWYKITTTQDGLLDVSACGMAEEFTGTVSLYKENVSYSDASAGVCPEGNGFYLRYEVKANETYFIDIKLPVAMDKNFNFSVANIDYPKGWAKENPIDAIKGDNLCEGLVGSYWYKYTVSVPSYLDVSNVGIKDFTGSLYLYNEDGTNQLAYGKKDFDKGGVSFKQSVEAGTYLINMTITRNSPKFNLIITDSPIEQGSECSNPIFVQTGENECSGKTEVWYSYEMSINGYLNISTNNALTDFAGVFKLYKTCDEFAVATSATVEDKTDITLKYKATPGTYLIQWTTTSDINSFKFTISERAFEQGEDCSNPILASLGDNALNLTEARETYYSYMPDKDGWLNISICNEAWTTGIGSVKVLTECNSKSTDIQTTACETGGQIYKTKVIAGTSYIICITNKSALPEITAFTLNMTDYVEGEVCERPIELNSVSGELSAGITSGSIWYHFVTEKAGNYTISSANLPAGMTIIGGAISSSYLSLKIGDCSAREIKSSATSSGHLLETYVDANVNMLVNIVVHKEAEGVTWNVVYKAPAEGTVCENPIRINLTKDGRTLEGVTGGSYSEKKSMWYAITPEVEGKLTVSTCHNDIDNAENTGFESMFFYKSCDLTTQIKDVTTGVCGNDYTAAGHTKTIEVLANNIYLVNLQTTYPNAFPVKFSLEEGPVSLNEVRAKGVAVAPNPNDGVFGVDLSIFGANKELLLEISNMQGQFVYKELVNSSIGNYLVRLEKVPSGIYILKVKEGDFVRMNKFVVK